MTPPPPQKRPRLYQITFTRSAERDLEGLDHRILKRVDRAISALADNPRPPGVKKLEGSVNSYRVRVGDYRILYEIEDEAILVVVVRVRHRRDVYR